MHSTGQMAWVGHDSFRLWHHFVVAVASEQNKATAPAIISLGAPQIRCVAFPRAGPVTLHPISGLLVSILNQPESTGIFKLYLYRIPPDFCTQQNEIPSLAKLTILK